MDAVGGGRSPKRPQVSKRTDYGDGKEKAATDSHFRQKTPAATRVSPKNKKRWLRQKPRPMSQATGRDAPPNLIPYCIVEETARKKPYYRTDMQ